MKTTPWYPPSTKPVREGPYQREDLGGIHFSYWDGRWHYASGDLDDAIRFKHEDTYTQNLPWRGVLK